MLWISPLLAAGCLGAVMEADPVAALPSLQRLSTALWAGPVLGVLAGLGHRCRVVRSLSAGDPPASRWVLRLMAATIVLPLGTLACPWWVALRDQLQQRRKATINAAMTGTQQAPRQGRQRDGAANGF